MSDPAKKSGGVWLLWATATGLLFALCLLATEMALAFIGSDAEADALFCGALWRVTLIYLCFGAILGPLLALLLLPVRSRIERAGLGATSGALLLIGLPTYIAGFLVNRTLLPRLLTGSSMMVNAAILLGALACLFLVLYVASRRAGFSRLLRRLSVAFAAGLALPLVTAAIVLALTDSAAQPDGDHRAAAASPSPTGAPNVLLITIDTLRARSLPIHGYDRIETPAISALARDGVTYLRAYSPVPETDPSHASILTGLYPIRHGLLHNGWKLPEKNVTLAEILAARGYRTGAAVSIEHLADRYGFGQGFEQFYRNSDLLDGLFAFGRASARFNCSLIYLLISDFIPNTFYVNVHLHDRTGEGAVDDLEEWLAETDERPFFFWIHLFDPHSPYRPPRSHRDRYSDRPVTLPRSNLEPALLKRLIRGYDEEVAYVDDQVGRMIEMLRSKELLDSTLIVFTADHGESLGEHDVIGHTRTIYDETLHVPLIFSWPKRLPSGEERLAQVRLIDLAPTILDLLGEPVPKGLDGVPLFQPFGGPGDLPIFVSTNTWKGSYITGIRIGDWKLIHNWVLRHRLVRDPGRQVELYHLLNDPGEIRNLARERGELTEELRRHTEQFFSEAAYRMVPQQSLDEETLEVLKSLGYL